MSSGPYLIDPARSRVLLVAASRFGEASGLDDLPSVRPGIEDLRAFLVDPAWGGLEELACRMVIDPETPAEVDEALVHSASEAEDTLLMYFSGHGVPHPSDASLHLAVRGTDRRRLHSTALPIGWIQNAMRESDAVAKILILDCCFSGRAIATMAGESVAAQATITGSCVIAAAPANRPAAAPEDERYTAFTGAFLQTLKDGVPRGPEYLDLETVFRSVRAALVGRGRSAPQIQRTNFVAEVALCRNAAVREPHEPTPAPPPRLEVALTVDPAECAAGEGVTWHLHVRNDGSSPLYEMTVLDGNGGTLEVPSRLEPQQDCELTWISRPQSDVTKTVTVGGRSERGALVSREATAHVTVRRPSPIGRIVAGLCAVLLIVSLWLTWTTRTSTDAWGDPARAAALLALATVVLLLAGLRGAIRASWRTTALAGTVAFAGLLAEDRLVLESDGYGGGRYVAILASAGIAFGGWLMLEIEAYRARQPPAAEVLAAAGGLTVIGSLWLTWTPDGDIGWTFTLTDIVLFTLAGMVTLMAVARRIVPGLGGSPIAAVVLMLVGAILAERVIWLRNLVSGNPSGLPWETGRYVALAGALLIIVGGAFTLLATRPTGGWWTNEAKGPPS